MHLYFNLCLYSRCGRTLSSGSASGRSQRLDRVTPRGRGGRGKTTRKEPPNIKKVRGNIIKKSQRLDRVTRGRGGKGNTRKEPRNIKKVMGKQLQRKVRGNHKTLTKKHRQKMAKQLQSNRSCIKTDSTKEDRELETPE